MEQMTGLDFKLGEIAGRIRELREIEGLTAADMAKKTAVSEEEGFPAADMAKRPP